MASTRHSHTGYAGQTDWLNKRGGRREKGQGTGAKGQGKMELPRLKPGLTSPRGRPGSIARESRRQSALNNHLRLHDPRFAALGPRAHLAHRIRPPAPIYHAHRFGETYHSGIGTLHLERTARIRPEYPRPARQALRPLRLLLTNAHKLHRNLHPLRADPLLPRPRAQVLSIS